MVFGLQLPKFGERNMSLSNNVFQAISVLMVMLNKNVMITLQTASKIKRHHGNKKTSLAYTPNKQGSDVNR